MTRWPVDPFDVERHLYAPDGSLDSLDSDELRGHHRMLHSQPFRPADHDHEGDPP